MIGKEFNFPRKSGSNDTISDRQMSNVTMDKPLHHLVNSKRAASCVSFVSKYIKSGSIVATIVTRSALVAELLVAVLCLCQLPH